MQGKNRYFRHSHLSETNSRRIGPCFAHDLLASKIAKLSDVSCPMINRLLFKLTNPNRPALWRLIVLLWRGWSWWILFRRAACSGEERAPDRG